MRKAPLSVLFALALVGCKRDGGAEKRGPVTVPDLGVADRGQIWYRASVRAPDGVEAVFFLGIPPPGAPGQAVFKVGGHEVRSEATFDGQTLKVPIAVHQTAIEAAAGPDGTLRGTFSASWRAWGRSSIPLAATKIAGPAPGALALAGGGGAALDLEEPRTIWRVALRESGEAKLVIDQAAPGEFSGRLHLDTGNLVYLAGDGRGDTLVMAGFDGTAGYRLELTLGADRKGAQGKYVGGHRLDWREDLTATRGADFAYTPRPAPAQPGARIGLPDYPELAALERGPLLVELAGSWCSTCRNAAPFLVELYREYRPRGLKMVTLLYEFPDDPAIDAQQAETFKKIYGVTWPVVPIQGDIDAFTEIMPTGLKDLNPAGFPITLFLAPDRSLVALHAGFPAPDDADEFRRVTVEFRATIEALLAGGGRSVKTD
jgi:thiol-disulfide isomerase/thioredoxin